MLRWSSRAAKRSRGDLGIKAESRPKRSAATTGIIAISINKFQALLSLNKDSPVNIKAKEMVLPKSFNVISFFSNEMTELPKNA